MLTGRPATLEDVRLFYPDAATSFRAWVVEMDGAVQAIGGLSLTRPIACAFSQFREPLRPHLRHPVVLRLIKKAQVAIAASIVPVRAVAEPGEPRACHLLERLGFRYIGTASGDRVFEYKGGK